MDLVRKVAVRGFKGECGYFPQNLLNRIPPFNESNLPANDPFLEKERSGSSRQTGEYRRKGYSSKLHWQDSLRSII